MVRPGAHLNPEVHRPEGMEAYLQLLFKSLRSRDVKQTYQQEGKEAFLAAVDPFLEEGKEAHLEASYLVGMEGDL